MGNSEVLRSQPILTVPPARSALAELTWPVIPEPRTGRLLAMMFQLDQSQWLPPAVLAREQMRQLSAVVKHAYATIPFYRARLSAADIDPGRMLDADTWSRMPILTRRDLQELGPAMVSAAVPRQHGPVGSLESSGSTGKPVTGYTTAVTRLMWNVLSLRQLVWHRRDPALKLAAIRWFKSDKALPPEGLKQTQWWSADGSPFQSGPGVALNIKATVGEQADWLLREKPGYLLTYPSNLLALAQHFRTQGLRLGGLQGVDTLSEICTPETRRWCREVFGVGLADIYSAREVGYMALQCPDHEHYHVQSESVLIEVLDADDRPCQPGEVGRVVVSTLLNFAAPLLRYEIGDMAEVGSSCPCGRGLPVLKRILGRVRNMLRLPNGDRIWPVFNLFEAETAIPFYQIQVVQKTLDDLEVHLVAKGKPTAEDEQKFAASLTAALRHPFCIRMRYVDSIARSAGGKYEDFLSELP
jgi:phenylacetate-CoA ligase